MSSIFKRLVPFLMMLGVCWSIPDRKQIPSQLHNNVELAQKMESRSSDNHNIPDVGTHHSDPEVDYSMSQLVTSQGYPVEEHSVETSDGYILGVFRIPHGKNQPRTTGKKVVFIQHGLLCSSTNWVTNLPHQALGFILADAGFDVWMGNSRGNKYSLKHKEYTTKDKEFWEFSWDQMALNDTPAVLDYITNATGQPHLHYVGHSQGTMQAFALFSRNQKYGSMVKTFFALAPVVTVGHIKSPVRLVSNIPEEVLFLTLGRKDFLPGGPFIDMMADTVCKTPVIRSVCSNVLFLLCGPNLSNLNKTRLPVYLSHTPAGTSTQNMMQYKQAVKSKAFQMYDYQKKEENEEHYGQATPPLYDVSKMETPVVLFTGGRDWLADPKDVSLLIPQLKNIVQTVHMDSYSHLDFIWGINAYKDIYPVIVNIINEDKGKPPIKI